ncbi:hypothetical protein [Xanthomonas arboricola]|uniref:hypothetical protein n=1 Tax=Xanthomonas arboricola TaxID=56448 RepID=UPI000F8D15B8|nr:hypothetical protein [Xanthomonas arboricola]
MADKWDRGLSKRAPLTLKRIMEAVVALLPYLYVSEALAIQNGMTHEGSLFGAPAWLRVDSDEQVTGTPKVPVLHLWCLLVDLGLEMASYFLRDDQMLVSPIKIGRGLS